MTAFLLAFLLDVLEMVAKGQAAEDKSGLLTVFESLVGSHASFSFFLKAVVICFVPNNIVALLFTFNQQHCESSI